MTKPRINSTLLWIVFWTCIAIISLILFSDHLIDSDEGVILNMSWQMWLGKKLYLDFFDYLPPGSSYSIFLLWKIFGSPSYLIAKIFSLCLWLISAIFLFKTSRLLKLKTSTSILITVFWLLICYNQTTIINHNWHSSFLAIISTYFAVSFLYRRSNLDIYFLAIFNALTTWFLHSKGLALSIAAISIIYFFTRPKEGKIQYVIYICSYFICLILLFFPWLSANLIHNLISPLTYQNYLGTSPNNPIILFIIILISIFMVWQTNKSRQPALTILTIIQLFIFLSFSYLIDTSHLLINIFPFILFIFHHLENKFYRYPLKLEIINYLSILTVLIIITLIIQQKNFSSSIFLIDIANRENIFQTDITKIEESSNVFAGPFLPNIYFELKKDNPYIWTHNLLYCNPDCQKNMLEIIQNKKPDYILVDYSMMKKYNYNTDNPVDRYITNNYNLCSEKIFNINVYTTSPCLSGELSFQNNQS